jgi:hypothetical protein
MEEDRETRTDEDVEAHTNRARNLEPEEDAQALVHKRGDEDDDDVEGHVLRTAPRKGQTKA